MYPVPHPPCPRNRCATLLGRLAVVTILAALPALCWSATELKAWLEWVHESYCARMMWQLAHEAGSFFR